MEETPEERTARFAAEHRIQQRIRIPAKICVGLQLGVAGFHYYRVATRITPTGANPAEHWGALIDPFFTLFAGFWLLAIGAFFSFGAAEDSAELLVANLATFGLTLLVALVVG
jgi:hypothetical protein